MSVPLPGHHDVIQSKDKCRVTSVFSNHRPRELQRSLPWPCPQRTRILDHMMTPDGDEYPKTILVSCVPEPQIWGKVQLLFLLYLSCEIPPSKKGGKISGPDPTSSIHVDGQRRFVSSLSLKLTWHHLLH